MIVSEYYDFEMEKQHGLVLLNIFSEGNKSNHEQKQSVAGISMDSCLQNFLKNLKMKL